MKNYYFKKEFIIAVVATTLLVFTWLHAVDAILIYIGGIATGAFLIYKK